MTDTATTSLAAWLLEQVSADEEAARAAMERAETPWRATYGRQVETARDGYLVTPEDEHSYSTDPPDEVAAHIARHDPAHVLAVAAAHRKIIEALQRAEQHVAEVGGRHENLHGLREAVRALAAAYAGRPGWREEWAG